MKNKEQIWTPNIYSILIPFILSLLTVFMNNIRNNAYSPLYNSITNLTNNSNIFIPYFYIMLSNFFSYFVGWILIICYVYIGYLSRKNKYIAKLPYKNAKLAQNIIYNQYYIVQYFYTALYNLFYGVINTSFFLIKMLIKYNDFNVIFYSMLVLIGFIIISILFMFLIKSFQIYYTQNYGVLMKFFNQLGDKSIITTNINFNIIEPKYFVLMKASLGVLLIPSFLEFINTTIAPISYLIFFDSYYLGKYSFGEFMQIRDMFTSVIFSIMFIINGCLDFGKFLGIKKELNEINTKNDCVFNETVILKGSAFFYTKEELQNLPKNYPIVIGKKYDFNLDVILNKKTYIYAPNGLGKTVFSQFFTFTNEHQLIEKLELPKNSIVIPEHAKFFFLDLNKKDYNQFIINYNLFNPSFHIHLNNIETVLEKFEYVNMETKWKIIAAYALLFDFTLWDDPFWGIENDLECIEIFNKHINSCLILGSRQFNNNIFSNQLILNSYLSNIYT